MKSRAPTCVLCGNEEDLRPIQGRLVCLPCCTCEHGFSGWLSLGVCLYCIREYFTWGKLTTGECLKRIPEYVAMCDALGGSYTDLLWWRDDESREIWDVGDRLQKSRPRRLVAPGNPSNAQPWPFPYPLIHKLIRR